MDNTELLAQVSRILYNGDPMKIGCECDEYDPEASTIVPRLHLAKNEDDVLDIVHEEFSRWFGGKSFVGPKKKYHVVSSLIWTAWLQSTSIMSAPSNGN